LNVVTRLTADPRRRGCGMGTEEGFTAKKLKTKNAKRIVGRHATLCATLRQIRSVKLKPHSLAVTNLHGEPIRPGAFSGLW